ncbi:MAG: hypothetical protein ACRCTZ_05525 [Sarcina sp.]
MSKLYLKYYVPAVLSFLITALITVLVNIPLLLISWMSLSKCISSAISITFEKCVYTQETFYVMIASLICCIACFLGFMYFYEYIICPLFNFGVKRLGKFETMKAECEEYTIDPEDKYTHLYRDENGLPFKFGEDANYNFTEAGKLVDSEESEYDVEYQEISQENIEKLKDGKFNFILPLGIFPDNLGINLCSVLGFKIVRRKTDSQIVYITIDFLPTDDPEEIKQLKVYADDEHTKHTKHTDTPSNCAVTEDMCCGNYKDEDYESEQQLTDVDTDNTTSDAISTKVSDKIYADVKGVKIK